MSFRPFAITFENEFLFGLPMDKREHWQGVYCGRAEHALSWFEDEPARSLEALIPALAPGDPVIDIGGGASRLVVRLMALGFGPVTVLDLSEQALELARTRLGKAASQVKWICADVTLWRPDTSYLAWHDRAVFHFLIDAPDRAAYVGNMCAATRPGAVAVILTFDEDGPETCSGLPVKRYSPQALRAEIDHLAPGRFAFLDAERFDHLTPQGNIQKFQMTRLRRLPD